GIEKPKAPIVFTVPEFRIDMHKRKVDVAIDGEVISMTPPLHYRSRPAALQVIVPKAQGCDANGCAHFRSAFRPHGPSRAGRIAGSAERREPGYRCGARRSHTARPQSSVRRSAALS